MKTRRRRDRLLELTAAAPGPELSTSLAVVAIDPAHCPACGAATRTATYGQPALFYMYGYGGLESTTRRTCPSCLWSIVVAETTSNPRR